MAAEITNEAKKRHQELEKALQLLHSGKNSDAQKALSQIIEKAGDDRRFKAGARIYLRICEKRLREELLPDKDDAEQLYDWGVYHHNAGRFKEAIEYYDKALKESNGDSSHIYYAMAATEALRKNADKAVEYLSKAVEQKQDHAFRAGGDPDFRSLASNKQFQKLVGSSSKA